MYRVKEIDGVFIPQKVNWDNWTSWDGIDCRDKFLWDGVECQKLNCSWSSLEAARERIESYKIQIKKPKVKYHYGK